VHIKRNFIKKFNWLKEKQKLIRSSVAPFAKGDVKSQTIKNRQDRKRYKRRKAKTAQERAPCKRRSSVNAELGCGGVMTSPESLKPIFCIE